MFQFAIVDDQKKDINAMNNVLNDHCTFHHIKYCVDTFSNPLEFNFNKRYDAVFLDIDMPEESGIILAHKINKTYHTHIIFMTQFSNYMHATFNVHPFHFLNKSHLKEESMLVLSLLFDSLNSQNILLKTKKGEDDVLINDIIYISIDEGVTYIHTYQKDIITWDALINLYEKLKKHNFEKANQSALVHLKYIKKLENNQITLKNDTVITISTRLQTSFKNSYKNYLLENL